MNTCRLLFTLCLTVFILHGLKPPGLCGGGEWKYLPVRHLYDIEGFFNQPTEVSISETGKVYVLDGANNEIHVFNREGKRLFSFGRAGSEEGEFAQPVGMDVDGQENIYVADSGNNRVQIFDHRGNFLDAITLDTAESRPVEVKVQEESGRLYISDAHTHQIICHERDGSFAFSWGAYGKQEGEFMYPGMTDMDAAGNLHVVDILNGRLQVFSPKGTLIRQIGSFGITAGTFFRPKGIAIAQDDSIFVSDSYTGVIQYFDSTGSLSGVLAEDGSTPLRLTTPLGMAIDAEQNYLYIVQGQLNKISVFALPDGVHR